uniref:Putative ovule protein n=1 Tax=Solanum chacoense TaxID=4108 RepID=A0A0V0H3G9_SOLCH
MRKEKEITTPKGTSRSLFEAINNSEVLVAKQVMEEGTYTYVDDNVIKSGPDLIEETDEEIQHRKDTEEDEDMEYNIQHISKAGNLSPRQTNSLKIRANKGKTTIPLHVKTRRRRDKVSVSDQ